MWNWFNCYLSGRHDYGMWCEEGAIFLRCMHCGKRSAGWAVHEAHPHKPTLAHARPAHKPVEQAAGSVASVVPFKRVAAN